MSNGRCGAELGAGVNGSITSLVNPVWPGAVLKASSPESLQDEAAFLELLRHANIVGLPSSLITTQVRMRTSWFSEGLAVPLLPGTGTTLGGSFACMPYHAVLRYCMLHTMLCCAS